MTYQVPEDMYEWMANETAEALYFEPQSDRDDWGSDDGDECPELPAEDGTYVLGNGWTKVSNGGSGVFTCRRCGKSRQ